jgi:hypothetical protein
VTKLSKPGDLADWAVKRAGNLDRMLSSARKSDADLYKQSMVQLDVLSKLLTSVGDEAGALYVASLARMLESKKMLASARGARKFKRSAA